MTLHTRTERLLLMLTMPEARNLKGATWCRLTSLSLVLTMTNDSREAQERLARLVDETEAKFKEVVK